MLLDDVDDLLVESVFEREVHAFLDVRDDDQCAHRGRQFVVAMLAVNDKAMADQLDAYRAKQTDAARAMSKDLK